MDCLDFSGSTTYGDWRDDLVKDGFAVIPAMSKERAKEHIDAFESYLEGLSVPSESCEAFETNEVPVHSGFGYNRNDPATLKTDNLPVISEKGSKSLGLPSSRSRRS